MLSPIDTYFLQHDEPTGSCLRALRSFLLSHSALTEAWKYGMPFYCYKKKMLCYLWTQKSTGLPYFGIVDGNLVEHPGLLREKRARMKILPVAPDNDLPLDELELLLSKMLSVRDHF